MAVISVYLNPEASQAMHTFHAEEFKKYFSDQEIRFQSPVSEMELVELIQQDREAGVDCIFSIGGDGTAHTIAQRLVGSKTKLLVLPGGTANDFAHELGTDSNLKHLAKIYSSATTREVDIININNRYLMTNGGIGIASEVAKEINILRRKVPAFKKFLKFIGKNSYSLMLIKQILLKRFKMHEVQLTSPDLPAAFKDKTIISPLILVNNQPRLAGKFPVAPGTKNNDGKFNVTVFLHQNKLSFIKTCSYFLLGKFPQNDKSIVQFETNQLQMKSLNDELAFFGDGENFTPAIELNITIIPKGLVVYSNDDDLILCSMHAFDSNPTIQ